VIFAYFKINSRPYEPSCLCPANQGLLDPDLDWVQFREIVRKAYLVSLESDPYSPTYD
jgi:hypothetical protein